MKLKLAAAVLAATTACATPALAADFTGPRVGATIGLADDDFGGSEVFTYGVNAGYDFDLGRAVVGGTIEYQDSSEDGVGRDLSATVRAGLKASENVLVYGLVGYTNLGIEDTDVELDGVRAGAGVEVALGSNAFGQVEYRYSNYEADVEGHQFVLGIGYRF
jgi:outer membrane immunogenic protein